MARERLSFFDDDEPRPRRALEGGAALPDDDSELDEPTGADGSTPLDSESPEPPEPVETKGRRRKRRAALLIPLLLLGLVFAGVVSVTGYYAAQVQRSVSQIARQPDALPTVDNRPAPAPVPSDAPNPPLNIAILGTDSRGPGDRGRSDSLMVLHISGDRKEAYFISFPRDMWVDIPGRGRWKINAAYAFGGPALSVQVLEQITGTRIDHVAMTNFDNFMKLVDVVGGVTVNNRITSTQKADSGRVYTFPAGPLTLNGEMALTYCRERYDLPNGDFDRAGRQRDVLKALLQKAATPEVLSNPAKVGELIGAVGKYVTVDEGLSSTKILSYAAQMKLSGGDSIKTLQAPLIGASTSTDGQWIAIYDPAAVAALGKAMREDTMATYYEGHKFDYAKPLPQVPSPK
jgi:LCP family protein required for cell wall assembly